jgi:hypothetical protein
MANIVISIIAIIKLFDSKLAHHPLEMIRQELGFDLNQHI